MLSFTGLNGEAWDGYVAKKMRKRLSYDTCCVQCLEEWSRAQALVNGVYKGGGEVRLKYGVFFAEQLRNESPGFKLL